MISDTQEKTAKLLTLAEIFKDRLFTVPDYQRGYAWEEEQVKALHEDIEQLFDADHLHFTGTIVLTKNIQDQRTIRMQALSMISLMDNSATMSPLSWLCNQASQIAPAFLRRFDYVMELNTPPKAVMS